MNPPRQRRRGYSLCGASALALSVLCIVVLQLLSLGTTDAFHHKLVHPLPQKASPRYWHQKGASTTTTTFLSFRDNIPTRTISSFLRESAEPTSMSSDPETTTTTPTYHVVIEYCTGCRWMLKSFWIAQELLTTFAKSHLSAVTIEPSDNKGIFNVYLNGNVLWDRKEQNGFPQPKDVKQQIRDAMDPDLYLGHSDTADRKLEKGNEVLDLSKDSIVPAVSRDEDEIVPASKRLVLDPKVTPQPTVTIEYCTGCQWLLRAAYLGQELMTTFGDDLKSVTLVPSRPPAKGGRFTVELDGTMLFDRSSEGRFPEVKEIKQMIRDILLPDRDLGHSDTNPKSTEVIDDDDDDTIDDDEATEARKYFGVI